MLDTWSTCFYLNMGGFWGYDFIINLNIQSLYFAVIRS